MKSARYDMTEKNCDQKPCVDIFNRAAMDQVWFLQILQRLQLKVHSEISQYVIVQ